MWVGQPHAVHRADMGVGGCLWRCVAPFLHPEKPWALLGSTELEAGGIERTMSASSGALDGWADNS